MNEQIINIMKDHLRRIDNDLKAWRMTEAVKHKEANEASKMVSLLLDQWTLIDKQLRELTGE